MDRSLIAVQVADKFTNAPFVLKHLVLIVPLIGELNAHSRIEK